MFQFLKRLWHGTDDKATPPPPVPPKDEPGVYREPCGCRLTTTGDRDMMTGGFEACPKHAGPAGDDVYEILLSQALVGHFFGGAVYHGPEPEETPK